jgi:hypothetical protein
MMLDLLGGFELRVGNTALRVVVPITKVSAAKPRQSCPYA